ALQEYPAGGTKMSSKDVLFQKCDVLIPAAIENQITEKNAAQVQAKVMCEGANGPTTWQADAIIDAKGVFTVPDILGNAGGVTVSYYEWVQDRQGFFWRESEVNERLLDVMERSFDEVVRYAETHKVNNRIAAYMLAIDRVATALKLRGIYAYFVLGFPPAQASYLPNVLNFLNFIFGSNCPPGRGRSPYRPHGLNAREHGQAGRAIPPRNLSGRPLDVRARPYRRL